MANEAVCIIAPTKFTQMTVADGQTIEKGTLLGVGTDPNVASGSFSTGTAGVKPMAFAGISWSEKVANDGRTTIAVAMDGEWDLTVAPGQTINLGEICALSGSNFIRQAFVVETMSGALIGKVLESAAASEVVRVRVGSL